MANANLVRRDFFEVKTRFLGVPLYFDRVKLYKAMGGVIFETAIFCTLPSIVVYFKHGVFGDLRFFGLFREGENKRQLCGVGGVIAARVQTGMFWQTGLFAALGSMSYESQKGCFSSVRWRREPNTACTLPFHRVQYGFFTDEIRYIV